MSEIRVSEIRISSNHRELHGAIFWVNCTFPGFWLCDKGAKQIPFETLCDKSGSDHCEDRSDLSFCLCGKYEWICEDNKECISKRTLCARKNIPLCRDESDQKLSFCVKGWTCPDKYHFFPSE